MWKNRKNKTEIPIQTSLVVTSCLKINKSIANSVIEYHALSFKFFFSEYLKGPKQIY